MIHFLVFSSLFQVSCVSSVQEIYPPKSGDKIKIIYVVSHGWHTGIVVKREDVQLEHWPESHEFRWNDFIEIGWGDEGFYQAEEITSSLTVSALIWPTSSVLHVVGFNSSVRSYFPMSVVKEITVSEKGFENLIRFINRSYARGKQGEVQSLGKGIYGHSRFYKAVGSYHLFQTCNHWTAQAIRQTGYPISTFYSFTAGNVLYQIDQE